MALDPRLADVQLLAIAAMRAQKRQANPPPAPTMRLRVVYVSPWEPEELVAEHVYELPSGGATW